MPTVIPIAVASTLVTASSDLVILWLSLPALSYGGQSGLMPWIGAGLILFGLVVVAIAAVAGVPGILWANHPARDVAPKWQRPDSVRAYPGTHRHQGAGQVEHRIPRITDPP